MKIKKYISTFLLLLCLFSASSYPVKAEETASVSEGSANVYIYMIGSDLESLNKQATADIQEIVQGIRLSQKDVGVFIYGGGTKTWHNHYFNSELNCCYYLCKDATLGIYAEERRDMTDPDTLKNFLTTAWEFRQAEHNYLIFWDHGGGTMGGFGVDEFYPESDGMSILEIAEAVEQSGIHFDAVGFDACLMGSVETALALSKSADYLIASKGVILGTGWDYASWVSALGNDPDISPEELGEIICKNYIEVGKKECPGHAASLSVTNLNLLSEKLPDALSDLGSRLCLRIAAGEYGSIAKARINAEEYGGLTNTENIDFLQFCCDLGVEEGDAMAEILRECVCCIEQTGMMEAGGLSLYLPFHSLRYTDAYLALCEELDIPNPYRLFISYFNAMEVCGQAAQKRSLSYFNYIYGEEISDEEILSEDELKQRMLDGISGENPFTELGLTERNSNFLKEVFSDEELLDLAVRFVEKYSFRPSRLCWIASGWGKQVLLGFSNQEKLVGKVYEEICLDLDGFVVDFGWLPVDLRGLSNRYLNVRALEWYAINDNVCVVYCLGSQDWEGETFFSAVIPANYNGVSGYLTARLTESGECSITGFMVGYTRENFGMWGKIISSTDFQDDDEIVLQAGVYDYDNTLLHFGDFSDSLRWGDGLTLEKKKLINGLKFATCYRVCDIYGNYYALEKEK